MSWIKEFYARHPEYRKVRVAKRTRGSIHFEVEPGRYAAFITVRPMFERGGFPASKFTTALKMGARLIRSPRAALAYAAMLPFAVSPYSSQPDETTGYDTLISNQYKTYNWGIYDSLIIGLPGIIGNRQLRSLIQFDVSSIPSDSTITAATLTLYCTAEGHSTDHTAGLYRALTQWYEGAQNGAAPAVGENASTWNLRNANGSVAWAGGAGGASGSDWAAVETDSVSITGAGVAFDFDGAADVSDWVDGSASNYGWWLIGDSEAIQNGNKNFASSSGATASQRPKLYVTYTGVATPRSFVVMVG